MSTESRQRSRRRLPWFILAIQGTLATACLTTQKEPPTQSRDCTACHGDPNRASVTTGVTPDSIKADIINRAAPPLDLNGQTDPKFRGVGAHQNHLKANDNHDPVACTECHVVPDSVFGKGHFDSGGHAQVTFGSLAKANGLSPTYDASNAKCSNTYCHQSINPTNDPKWQEPRESAKACDSCHGLPPPAPHPQSSDCFRCHGNEIDANRHFIDRSLHINGKRDTGDLLCNTCHGTDSTGAPPRDLAGNTTPDHPGVGAHQNHLTASPTHDAIACSTCHVVPEGIDLEDPKAHMWGTPPAPVTFSGLATAASSSPKYDTTQHTCSSTYCHGKYQPVWTSPRDSTGACGSCHGLPPPAPHPQNSKCAQCHSEVIDAAGNFVNRSLHLNGKVEIGTSCNSCHGTTADGAPPVDLEGNTTAASAGVGAHKNHLTASATHLAVPCTSCHTVPTEADPSKPNSHVLGAPPATITFGGMATANGSNPAYDAKTHQCTGSYCHGAYQPTWTAPRDSTAACGSCHGAPPLAPHPQNSKCGHCHSQVIGADGTFVNLSLHINGTVEKDTACNSCHGTDQSGGPPPDLEGNTTSDHAGVGAHNNHLQASDTHDAVPCDSCHVVPATVDAPGHLGTAVPAEITFSRLATANNSTPTYDASKHQCSGSYCHGSFQPTWTAPRDSAGACGSCHGLPPPAPHPQNSDCSQCHAAVIDANRHFINKSLHINGVVNVGTGCNGCHGSDPTGAPPPDLQGNTTPDHAGVGAHQNHLQASSTHAAVSCSACHTVPADVNSPGHLDSPLPAEVTFSGLANASNSAPTYDASTHQCSGSYCHGSYQPVWTAPRDSSAACGSCHGLPPPALHPQRSDCSSCHGQVVDANRNFVNASLHVNGTVDVVTQCNSCHGLPPPAPHPQKPDCSSCHGQVVDANRNIINTALHDNGTVDVVTQCNSCHGSALNNAPPTDVSGNSDPSLPGVGAHQRHVQASATHGAVACDQCHVVPSAWNTPGHFDGTPPAPVTFGSLATQSGYVPNYSNTTFTCTNVYCHLSAVPNWVAQRPMDTTCGTCHALPPPFVAGVALSAQSHPKGTDCSRCHGSVIDNNGNFISPESHVNGTVDVSLTCSSCHGSSASPAPPVDLSGNTQVSALGVGAHQAHLNGSQFFRPVLCSDCHQVPQDVNDPGHIDDWTTAEVKFSGAAIARNRLPTWDRQSATCANAWCHSPDPHGGVSPVWNDPNVSIGCDTCHGFPPAAPHAQSTQCGTCHTNYRSSGSFIDSTLHVNGTVDF